VRIVRHIAEISVDSPCVAACGSFDGLHLGHRRLLAALAEAGRGVTAVVFDDSADAGGRMASRRRCFSAFDELAADLVVMARGGGEIEAALARLSPVETLLAAGESFPAKIVRRKEVRVVDGVALDGRPVTSARLRDAVASGDVRAATAMIGGPYTVDGRVIHGFHRGATIGVPTANLRVQELQLPPDGVYAVTARTGDFTGVGVANLGTNPTFGNEARSLETNIFDFQGDLYGARLEVGFVERLRGEIKFDGVDALVAQIRRDIDDARLIHRRDDR
jgi:riboflavin kinase/FMN adenylyltransferase